jgi:hypothetical protein
MSMTWTGNRVDRQPARHRQEGRPSYWVRNYDFPWWSVPVVTAFVAAFIILWVSTHYDAWVGTPMAAEAPPTAGVALSAENTPTHAWFGIIMQCWNESHEFVVRYETDTAGSQGWEPQPPTEVSLQTQAREGDEWHTLPTTKDSQGRLVVDERKTPASQRWLRNKKGVVLRLIAPDGFSSTTQRIGYGNTCTGGSA